MAERNRCPKCDALNAAAASACSLCGEPLVGPVDPGIISEGVTAAQACGDVRSATLKGGLARFGMGWLVAGAMFLVGIVLTLTGIGAIIGIPLIIGAVLSPFVIASFWAAAGRRQASQQVGGLCPYCAKSLVAVGTGFDCPTCGQRVIHRGGRFLTLEAAKQDRSPSGA